jgi:glycosyltransferase involved in cell wall biosynthesis
MPTPRDAVVLLTGGRLDRMTGGNLYDRHLCESLAEAGVPAAVHVAPPDHYPRLTIVDSIAINQAFRWVARRPRGSQVVALMHMLSSLVAGSSQPRQRWRRLEKAYLRHVDLVVAASEDLAGWLRRLDVPEARLQMIPPGKDGPQPPPAIRTDMEPEQTRRDPADPVGRAGMRLLCIANWFPVKNLDVLIHAVSRLPENVMLDLVGDPTADPMYAEVVMTAIRQHGLGPRVHVRGPIAPERMGTAYAASDVAILPSAYEGYATTVAEALWFGLPVVATSVGGVRHLVTSGVEGFLVPPGRPRPLAEALRRLHDDVALRRRMAAAAAARGTALPSWRDARQALVRLLLPLVR